MRAYQFILLALTLTAMVACGGSQTTSGTTGEGDSVASEACEGYRLGDSCVDELSFAQCQQMAAQCPGQVQVMESCPLQFACPE